jgi:hypothetical protein
VLRNRAVAPEPWLYVAGRLTIRRRARTTRRRSVGCSTELTARSRCFSSTGRRFRPVGKDGSTCNCPGTRTGADLPLLAAREPPERPAAGVHRLAGRGRRRRVAPGPGRGGLRCGCWPRRRS